MNDIQVVMFPGLGASYPSMVARYLRAYPGDADAVAHWSRQLGVDLGAVHAGDARELERSRQFEIHALNLLWWRRRAPQFGGAALCGHSLGYYAALVAAGVVGEDDSFRLIDTVFDTTWRGFADSDDAIVVVTTKDECDFDAALAGIEVEVLSRNSQLQRVLYGQRSAIDAVRARLGGHLLAASEVGARVPFHSQRLREQQAEVAGAVDALGICAQTLRAPLWSHVSARPLRNGDEALALVVEQLHRPVHWHRLVDALIQAGRWEFVELGPNRVLSQLVRWISPQLDISFSDHLRRQAVAA